MKKITSIILTLAIMLVSIPALPIQASTTIKIGDYVQIGIYYDEPILWRCVDIDENGPLILADKIISIKPFDANGTTHKYLNGNNQADNNYHYRRSYGSNLWQTSNMRCWLNSTSIAGNVTWLDGCPPIAANLSNGYNEYVDSTYVYLLPETAYNDVTSFLGRQGKVFPITAVTLNQILVKKGYIIPNKTKDGTKTIKVTINGIRITVLRFTKKNFLQIIY